MPRVRPLTEAVRKQERYQSKLKDIRYGLGGFKAVEGCTNDELADRVGVSHTTYSRLINGQDVSLSFEKWLKIFDAAGFEIKKRKTEDS